MRLVEQAVFTDKVEAMAVFYETLLDHAPIARSDGMVIFMQGAVKIFIHEMYEAQAGDLPPEDHTAFEVDQLDVECARLVSAGLKLEVAPADYYWGRSAYLRDPAGQLIELIEANEAG